jgi:hypothetical protein
MIGVIWETPERRGCLWRLEVAQHNGRTFANWRKWWRDADGVLKPTKQGVTFALELLVDLNDAVDGWLASNVPSGPENRS